MFSTGGGGITKLSQLTIDADKDWQLKGISNIKEVVAGMVKGDLVFFNGTKLVVISVAGSIFGAALITLGPTHDPIWGFVA